MKTNYWAIALTAWLALNIGAAWHGAGTPEQCEVGAVYPAYLPWLIALFLGVGAFLGYMSGYSSRENLK